MPLVRLELEMPFAHKLGVPPLTLPSASPTMVFMNILSSRSMPLVFPPVLPSLMTPLRPIFTSAVLWMETNKTQMMDLPPGHMLSTAVPLVLLKQEQGGTETCEEETFIRLKLSSSRFHQPFQALCH